MQSSRYALTRCLSFHSDFVLCSIVPLLSIFYGGTVRPRFQTVCMDTAFGVIASLTGDYKVGEFDTDVERWRICNLNSTKKALHRLYTNAEEELELIHNGSFKPIQY